jgi:hypothetical protein
MTIIVIVIIIIIMWLMARPSCFRASTSHTSPIAIISLTRHSLFPALSLMTKPPPVLLPPPHYRQKSSYQVSDGGVNTSSALDGSVTKGTEASQTKPQVNGAQ